MKYLKNINTDQKVLKIDFLKLDSLRGIASFYVLLNHSRGWLWSGMSYVQKNEFYDSYNWYEKGMSFFNLFTRLGHEFVIVFFVLSGFSIAHSLSKEQGYYKFIKKRFIRLYPPYLVAIMWAYLSFILAKEICPLLFDSANIGGVYTELANIGEFISFENTVFLLLYMPTGIIVAQFWSLGYEVMFYLLALFQNKYFKLYLFISLCLFFLGLIVYNKDTFFILTYVFRYNIYFVLGMFLYRFRFSIFIFFSNISTTKKCSIMIALFLSILSLNVIKGKHTIGTEVLSGIFTICLIDLFLSSNFRIKTFEKLGKYSYTIYISHLASITLCLSLYHFIFGLNHQIINPFVYLLSVPFSLVIAWFLYNVAERQSKFILDKIRSKEN